MSKKSLWPDFRNVVKNHETFLPLNKLLTQFPRIKSSKSVLEHFGDSKLLAFKFFLFALRSIVAIWFLKNKSWLWYVKPNFQKKVKNPTFKKWIFLVCQNGKVKFSIGLASWFDFTMYSRLPNKQTCHLLGNYFFEKYPDYSRVSDN